MFDVEAEFEVLWIDPADADIRDVAHCAHGERKVESSFFLLSVGAFQLCYPLGPARTVVVFRIQTFAVRLQEDLDHFSCAVCGVTMLNPGKSVAGSAIEVVHVDAVVRENRPAKIGKAARPYGRLKRAGRPAHGRSQLRTWANARGALCLRRGGNRDEDSQQQRQFKIKLSRIRRTTNWASACHTCSPCQQLRLQ